MARKPIPALASETQENPKILHRIYFDNFAPFKDPFEHFLESWSREMPDYKIMRWNASNLDVNENEWTRRANKDKAPVFLAEYFRWKVLSEYGGVYLDADCEILDGKVLSKIVDGLYNQDKYSIFFGVEEKSNGHPTAQTMGAKKGSKLVEFMKGLYEDDLHNFWPWRESRGLIGPQLMSLFFLNQDINKKDNGFFKNIEKPVILGEAKIYPQVYFSPKFALVGGDILFEAGKTCIYHMFANSNVDFSRNKSLNKAREQALTFDQYREALKKAQRFPRTYDSDWLSTVDGIRTPTAIKAQATSGIIVHGPYISLSPGAYEVDLVCDVTPRAGSAVLSVTSSSGALAHASKRVLFPLGQGETLSLPFEVLEPVKDVEAVLVVDQIDAISVDRLEIKQKRSMAVSGSAGLKVLHRIYFGFDGKPDGYQAYLDTWKEQLPDFEIVHWNASNLPMKINAYVEKLHAEKDHAFLTDYFRWYVLREHGGSYLDADVEIVNGDIYRNLIEEMAADDRYDALIGIDEKGGGWYTAHSMASKPGSEISRFMCELYDNFGSFAAWRKKGMYFWAPQLAALYFANKGHNVAGMGTSPNLEHPTITAGVKIYPQDWFSPVAPTGNPNNPFDLNAASANTALCHHFACSWHDEDSIYLSHSRSAGGQANAMLKDLMEEARNGAFDAEKDLHTLVGVKRNGEIATTGRDGVLVYGPYISLKAGHYRAEIQFGNTASLKGAEVDVIANRSVVIATRRPITGTDHKKTFTVEFELPENTGQIECRIMSGKKSKFSVSKITFHNKSN